MTEDAALRAAIVANPDEDTPRLAYADWLDENRPDNTPSPAASASARAEYIRVQCRLAAGAFADPDYPELLEREHDLADWLNVHDPETDPQLDGLTYYTTFGTGEWSDFRRGFLEFADFEDYSETPEKTVAELTRVLEEQMPRTTARSLRLEDATADEIVGLARHPVFSRLRGFQLDYLSNGEEDEAVAAIAESPHSAGLRRLYVDFVIGARGFEALAGSKHLGNLESLVLDYPVPAASLKVLIRAKWFRNLRRLNLWTGNGDTLRVLGEALPMPRLVSLSICGSHATRPASVRRFVASESFPRLMHLDVSGLRLPAEHVVLLARGKWPLRHLALTQNEVRRAGAEALAAAEFAPTLRVLELEQCEITAGGVQALAEGEALAGLRHLDLSENPVGPGGLAALAGSVPLRGLRALKLLGTNKPRAPISAADVLAFLSGLTGAELRHLNLAELPVAVRGARVLATSPAFANLTRLELANCSLGERGTEALVGSSSLTDLVYLSLDRNKVGSGAGKLANPKVFPRLATARLGHGIPKATATRLRRRPGIDW